MSGQPSRTRKSLQKTQWNTTGVEALELRTMLSADFDLDVDGDGEAEPLSDGLLIQMYVDGMRGEALTARAPGPDATRGAGEIEVAIEALLPLLDVEIDGATSSLSDPRTVLEYLFGVDVETLLDDVWSSEEVSWRALEVGRRSGIAGAEDIGSLVAFASRTDLGLDHIEFHGVSGSNQITLGDFRGESGAWQMRYRVAEGDYRTDFDPFQDGVQPLFVGSGGVRISAAALGLTVEDMHSDGGDIKIGNTYLDDDGKITITGELNATSATGPSGDISITAENRDDLADAGPDFLGITLTDATLTGGDITLSVLKNNNKSRRQLIALDSNDTNITIKNSTITASGDVSITAYSEDLTYSDDMPQWYSHIDGLVNNFIDGVIPIPNSMGVFVREASASVDVDDSNISSNGNLTIESNSQAHASMVALATRSAGFSKFENSLAETFVRQFSFGFSKATGSATTEITGDSTLLATGNISVTATTDVIAKVSARTTTNISLTSPANPGSLSASVGITLSDTTATVDIGEDVTVTSQQGDVELQATGDVENTSSATAASYIDGMGGVTFAYGHDTATVTTDVQGVVSSHGTQESNHVFDTDDVIEAPDGILNEITIPNHDYKDGDVVEYVASLPTGTSGTPEPIGGLINGESLQVIVIDSNTIQLQRGAELNLSLPPGDADSTHSLSPSTSLQFDPQAMSPHPAVNTTDHTITLPGNDFVTGQAVKYVVTPPTESTPATDTTPEIEAVPSTPIGASSGDDDSALEGALYSGATYYVIVVDAGLGSFRLAETLNDALSDVAGDRAVAFTTSGEGHEHYFVYEPRTSLQFDPNPGVTPNSVVNTTDHTITLPGNGFETGQAVKYVVTPPTESTPATDTTPEIEAVPSTPIGAGSGDDDPALEGALYSGATYYVIVVDAGLGSFRLAETLSDVAGDHAVAFTNSGEGHEHYFVHETDAMPFQPDMAVNETTNTIDVDTTGIETGDALVYRPDPDIQTERGISRNYGFVPDGVTNLFDPTGTIDFGEPVLDPSVYTLTIENHGWSMGEQVAYDPGSLSPMELSDGSSLPDGMYYVIVIDADTIQLASEMTGPAIEIVSAPEPGDQHLGGKSFDPSATVQWQVADPVDNTVLFEIPHGLVTGQRITYLPGQSASGQPNSPVGGLVVGEDYYVIRISDYEIQLSQDRIDNPQRDVFDGLVSVDDGAVDLGSGATGGADALHQFFGHTVDTLNDWIISPNHELETGQAVTYNGGDGAAIGGLTDGTTYYAIRLDGNAIRLADSLEDASTFATAPSYLSLDSAGTGTLQTLTTDSFVFPVEASRAEPVVNTTKNTIELVGHGLTHGQKVNYQASGGQEIGGLTDDTYYVVLTNGLADLGLNPANYIQLKALEVSGAISLSPGATLGAGLHLFRVIPDVELYNREDPVIIFDPTAVPPFAVGANTLRVPGHGLSTGDSVRYLTGGGEAIGGLTNGDNYLAVVVDENLLQFTAPEVDATAANAIVFTSKPGDGAVHGVQVQSTVTQNDLPVTGLGSGLTYYAIVDGPNALRLAESPPEVLNALPITFDISKTNADTVHTLVEKSGIIVGSTLTASNKQNAGSALGSEPTFNDFVNKGEVMFSKAPIFSFNKKLKDRFDDRNKYKDLFDGMPTFDNGSAAIAASAAVNDVSHTVRTTVGDEASTGPLTQLTSDGDITIDATIKETSQVKSQGNVVPGSAKKFAGGFAFAIGLYENTAETTVEGNARIDAAADVSIASDVAYPLVIKVKQLDPFYDCTTDTVGDGCHPITDLATALDGSGGLTRILNTWANTKAFTPNSKNLPAVAFTLSVGLNVYDNNSTATIRTGAKINQDLDLQAASSPQTVALSADTTQQFVTLAGIMHLRVNAKTLVGLRKKPNETTSQNNAISFFGNKSGSFGFGGSTMLQFLDNTTAAVVEEGVAIHTDTSGSGLTVKATETVHSTQIAQSGSDSDKGAVAASAVYAGHESTTVAQVDAGVTIDGGALNITSSSDVITEAVTGGFSWGPIGIGMSGGVINVKRHTGAFVGRRKWSDEYTDELPYGSAAGVDLPAALGTLTVAALDVAAENKGVTVAISPLSAQVP